MKTNFVILSIVAISAAIVGLQSCASIPKKAKPVSDFSAERYLGTWFEIARFDYRFEKNLNNVIAQYSLKKNGEIKVLNSGFNFKKEKWASATGSAKFRINEKIGALKVSFFKPFYAGYNVIAIDKDYKYALVAGRNLKYLWLLSREKTMPESIKKEYLQIAQSIGYQTDQLIWVEHNQQSPFLKK